MKVESRQGNVDVYDVRELLEAVSIEIQTDNPTSSLVKRLITARDDPGKRRIRDCLLRLSDQDLKTKLGMTDADVRALRTGEPDLPRAHRSIE